MKVLILLGGDPPCESLVCTAWRWADRVICADGGANILPAMDLWPDVLLGDMDSVKPEALAAMRARGVEIVRHNPHKDLTDGQLACRMAIAWGAQKVRILGGWGGRADHSYANLMLLRYLAQSGVEADMKLPDQWVRVCGPGRHLVPGTEGAAFSLLPISENVIISAIDGAEYPIVHPTPMPLNGAPDGPLGISNRMTGPEAGFCLEQGWILCFYADSPV